MIHVLRLLLEEPTLERRQGRFTADDALLGGDRLALAGYRRQFRNRLMLENLPGRELHTGMVGARDNLDAQDGVSTQLKEVVFDSDPIDAQQRLPNGGDDEFDLVAWSNIFVSQIRSRMRWQNRALLFELFERRFGC